MESVTLQRYEPKRLMKGTKAIYQVKDTDLWIKRTDDNGWEITVAPETSLPATHNWLEDHDLKHMIFPTLRAIRWALEETADDPPVAQTHHHISFIIDEVSYTLVLANGVYQGACFRRCCNEYVFICPDGDGYRIEFSRLGQYVKLGSYNTLRQCMEVYHHYKFPRHRRLREWLFVPLGR